MVAAAVAVAVAEGKVATSVLVEWWLTRMSVAGDFVTVRGPASSVDRWRDSELSRHYPVFLSYGIYSFIPCSSARVWAIEQSQYLRRQSERSDPERGGCMGAWEAGSRAGRMNQIFLQISLKHPIEYYSLVIPPS